METHRHFDGSHSPIQMWEKVKATLPDDTNFEEFKNYVLSNIKDLQTNTNGKIYHYLI